MEGVSVKEDKRGKSSNVRRQSDQDKPVSYRVDEISTRVT